MAEPELEDDTPSLMFELNVEDKADQATLMKLHPYMSLKGELTVHANNGLHLSMTRAGMCSLYFAPALSATSGDCRAVTLLVEVAWFPATVPTEHPPLASTACGIVLGDYVIGFSPGAAAPLGSTLSIDGPGGRSMDLGQVPQLGCYSTLVVVVRRSGQIEASLLLAGAGPNTSVARLKCQSDTSLFDGLHLEAPAVCLKGEVPGRLHVDRACILEGIWGDFPNAIRSHTGDQCDLDTLALWHFVQPATPSVRQIEDSSANGLVGEMVGEWSASEGGLTHPCTLGSRLVCPWQPQKRIREMTVEAWVRLEGSALESVSLCSLTSLNASWDLRVGCRGVEFVLEVHGEPMHVATNYDKPIEAGRWYHVAGTVARDGGVTAYLNGVGASQVVLTEHHTLDSWLYQKDAEIEVMRISPPLSAEPEEQGATAALTPSALSHSLTALARCTLTLAHCSCSLHSHTRPMVSLAVSSVIPRGCTTASACLCEPIKHCRCHHKL